MTIVPHHLRARRQSPVFACEIVKASPNQAFHIIVNISSNLPIHLPARMIIAYTEPSPPEICECKTKTQKISAKGTLEALRKLHANLQSPNILEHINALNAVARVQCRASRSSIKRMAQHTTAFHEENKRLTQNWCTQVRRVSQPFCQYVIGIRAHARRTSGNSHYSKTPYQASRTYYTTSALSDILCWTEGPWVRKIRVHQDTWGQHCLAHTYRMGIFNRFQTKERRQFTVLRGLLLVERSYKTSFVLYPLNERRWTLLQVRQYIRIASPGEASIFSTLGANSGYWYIKTSESNQDRTVLTSYRGLYRVKRMPVWL